MAGKKIGNPDSKFSFSNKLKNYKNLVQNFTSLSVLQISNYIFPLIVLPYVVRVLGPDKYGLVQFAAAFSTYLQLICDYNFALTGTRLISQNRNDQKKLSEIFSSIIFIKIILFLVTFILFIVIILSIEKFSIDSMVYILSAGMVLGSVLSPLWFFQGIEKMKYITIIQVSVRIVATIFIFLFIQAKSDYLVLVIINSSAQIAIGLTGLAVSIIVFKVKVLIPGKGMMINILKHGWNVFLSSIWINFYTTSNTFLLGLFTNNTIVGYYAGADKIRIAFQGIHSTLSLSVFPFVSNLVKESYEKFINFNRKLLKLSGAGGLIISVLLFVFANPITNLILGKDFKDSSDLLRIISVLPFLISFSNVFGIQTMLPLGFDKSFNKIIGLSALLHIILLFVIIPTYFAEGVAYTVVLTELIVTVSMYIFLRFKKINLFA